MLRLLHHPRASVLTNAHTQLLTRSSYCIIHSCSALRFDFAASATAFSSTAAFSTRSHYAAASSTSSSASSSHRRSVSRDTNFRRGIGGKDKPPQQEREKYREKFNTSPSPSSSSSTASSFRRPTTTSSSTPAASSSSSANSSSPLAEAVSSKPAAAAFNRSAGVSTAARISTLESLLQAARRDGTSIKLPTLLDRPKPVKKVQRTQNMSASSSSYSPRPLNKTAAPLTSRTTTSTFSSSKTFTPLPTSASSNNASISDRRTYTQVDELVDVMSQQQSIVQPPNPHIANIVILGTPNAGKSTLVNHLVGAKISAISHKRNTTRTSVLGVATKENRQLVLFDTPGVLPAEESNKYQKELTTSAYDTALSADVACIMIDAVKHLGTAEYELFNKANELLKNNPDMKLVLVINKTDLCKPASKSKLLGERLSERAPFHAIYYTSFMRTTDQGVTKLTNALYELTHPGDWEYPAEMTTDQSQIELVNEIVREKIFHRVHQEIPYRVRITNEGWTVIDEKSMRIDIRLEVDTKQQKAILTGYNESMLRFITQRALPEIETLVGKKVFLFFKCGVANTW